MGILPRYIDSGYLTYTRECGKITKISRDD